MAEAASVSFPHECCGILIGAERGGCVRLTRAVHAANVVPAAVRRRRFEIDPAALIAVQRQLRDAGGRERLIGYFHSHPFGPLRPSAADLAGAHETGLVAVIVTPSGRTGRAGFGIWLRFGQGPARRFRPLALRGVV
ncbi:MAG TPA: M67 family metallopeptidase [Parvibaculum sp.]